MNILPVIGWQLAYTLCVLVFLGVWFITSVTVACCMLCGVCRTVSGEVIGAAGVDVGSGCMMLACVCCALGTFFTCSSSLSMRPGCVFWDGVGVSLMLVARRSFTGYFCLLPRIACMCPMTVTLELGG